MIAARSLRKCYGPAVVLGDVSLDLGAGQCPPPRGPTAAGSAPLLRILAARPRPAWGTLSIGGADALREPARARELIAMVGHGSYLYPDLTALENLRFWAVMGDGEAGDARLVLAL